MPVDRIGAAEPREISFELNGGPVTVWATPHRTLMDVLREDLGATEVKYGCGEGVCGTCTVLLDGGTVNACLIFAVQADGAHVTTLKGLLPTGENLHHLQESFLEHGGSQCGFCTPGMLLTAFEALRDHPGMSREEIRTALSGNLCRCTGYTKIVDAVAAVAQAENADDARAGTGER